jgi:osmotically-inducible protein OsmY
MSELLKMPVSASDLLAESIEEAVHKGTLGGVAGLAVEVRGGTILLRGHCASYYCKQLAQQLAMTIASDAPLCNHIRVK